MPKHQAHPRTDSALTPRRLTDFLLHLGRTGSVTYAAARTGLRRTALYQHRARDEGFAERWAEALDLGIERLQDNALQRALEGDQRPVFRNGRQVGQVRHYDNRLLQFLLRAHRPEIYGERKGMAPALPFDLVKRMAAAERRLAKHRAASPPPQPSPCGGGSTSEPSRFGGSSKDREPSPAGGGQGGGPRDGH